MKFTLIVAGNPLIVIADSMERVADMLIQFWTDGKLVGEFNANKVDGIIWEDNNGRIEDS